MTGVRRLAAALMAAAGLLVPGLACSGGGDSTTTTEPASTTGPESTASTVPATPATVPTDGQSLMAVLGPPDVFVRELQVLDGQDTLVESYTYAELGQRFDLIGGQVVGNEAIEPFPDGTLLPLQYAVYEVWPGSQLDEVKATLDGVEFTTVDASALELPEGSTVLAAPQLVLGLLDGRVVYVETFALVPDPAGEFEAYVEGSEP